MTDRSEAVYRVLKALEQIEDINAQRTKGRRICPDKRDYREIWDLVQEHSLEGLLVDLSGLYIIANSMATYTIVEYCNLRAVVPHGSPFDAMRELERISLPDRPDIIHLMNSMGTGLSDCTRASIVWKLDHVWGNLRKKARKELLLDGLASVSPPGINWRARNRGYRAWSDTLSELGVEHRKILDGTWLRFPGSRYYDAKYNAEDAKERLSSLRTVIGALEQDGAHWLMFDSKRKEELCHQYGVTTLPAYDYDHLHSLSFATSFSIVAEHQPLVLWVALLRLGALSTTIFARAFPEWLEICVERAKEVEPGVDWDAAVKGWVAD